MLPNHLDDCYAGMAFGLFFLGRYEEAIGWADRALRERPRLAHATRVKAMATAMAQRAAEEVREATRRLLEINPNATVSSVISTQWRGNRDKMEPALRKAGLPE